MLITVLLKKALVVQLMVMATVKAVTQYSQRIVCGRDLTKE